MIFCHLTTVSNFVGHSRKCGCRMLCSLTSQHKPGRSQYYPVLLKLNQYDIPGSNHEDINALDIQTTTSQEYIEHLHYLLGSQSMNQFQSCCLETGIVGPSVLLGLQPAFVLGIPECFSSDLMHLIGANMADLWCSLFWGTLDCAQSNDRSTWYWAIFKNSETWEVHGQAVANCKQYLPGSFNVAPHDPSLHANSWYKCTEYITWLYGLCPGLLCGILPNDVWQNFYKFIASLCIMSQYSIELAHLQRAQERFTQWENDFKLLFYQQRIDHIHFIRSCVHLTSHLASEAARIGSPILSSQWTMEWTIRNLTHEICQPSDPFFNLAQQGIHRCQINALKAMIPSLDNSSNTLPCGSADLGNGYVLLPKRDVNAVGVTEEETWVIATYLQEPAGQKIRWWGQLQLPNGQIAWLAYVELQRSSEQVCMVRNVKVRCRLIWIVVYSINH